MADTHENPQPKVIYAGDGLYTIHGETVTELEDGLYRIGVIDNG